MASVWTKSHHEHVHVGLVRVKTCRKKLCFCTFLFSTSLNQLFFAHDGAHHQYEAMNMNEQCTLIVCNAKVYEWAQMCKLRRKMLEISCMRFDFHSVLNEKLYWKNNREKSLCWSQTKLHNLDKDVSFGAAVWLVCKFQLFVSRRLCWIN